MLISIVVVVEVKDEWEGEAVVDFVSGEGFVIEVEALKHEVEQFRQADELYSSLG